MMQRLLPVLILAVLILAALSSPALARDSLGVFEGWGAFRDARTPRCYAIAEPVEASPAKTGWRAFASVGHWPRQRVRGQFQVRLSRQRAPGSRVTLAIGERRIALVAGDADAWAANKRDDAAIIAAIRSARSMSVEATGRDGRGFADTYDLRGAATAIDAAALGCGR